MSLIISYLVSSIFLLIFLYINYLEQFDNYLIIGFLLVKLILYIKEYKFILRKFYLERYLNEPKYKKVKYIKSLKQLRKNYYNFIRAENEKKVLSRMFE